MSVLDGDFIGFSFDDVHSSDLGVLRVSDGSRYNEYLLPTSQDVTVQVPGGDGTYYFGSYYTGKPFPISIAFDSLTEEQLRKLRQTFTLKKIGRLVFDEAPYKYYMAKVVSQPQLKYICFGRPGEPRVYKGEGTIQFMAYYPYAKSTHLSLKDSEGNFYKEFQDANRVEWAEESGLPETSPSLSGATVTVENVGDLEMDWRALYSFDSQWGIPSRIEVNGVGLLTLSNVTQMTGDSYIAINSKTNLIEGLDADENPTGNLYNKYISGGAFFKIPVGNYNFSTTGGAGCYRLDYEYIYY